MVSKAVLGSGLGLMIPEVFSNHSDSGVSPGFGTCFSHGPPAAGIQNWAVTHSPLPAVPAWAFFHYQSLPAIPSMNRHCDSHSFQGLRLPDSCSLLQSKCLLSQPFTPVHVDLSPWLIPLRQLQYLWDISWFLCSDFPISALFLISQGSSCTSQL